MQRQTDDRRSKQRKQTGTKVTKTGDLNHKRIKKGETIMKTLKTTIAAMMIMLTSLAASAQPMSVYAMRNNARFLTDRMAYTLGLSAALVDDLYYINYDYICGVNDYLDAVALGYRYDDYMEIVYARDYALRRLLTERQWALLMSYDYFYRPIAFNNHRWSFSIYLHDRRMDHFFYAPPRRFNDYRGGTVFGGMRRIDVPGGPRPGGLIPGAGRPGDMRPGNMGAPNNARPGDNRMGDMRGEVIRQGNNAGNDRPYRFENPSQNRGSVGTPNNVGTPNTVNRPSGNINVNTNNTRSTVTPTTRPSTSTVTSFPGAAGRTSTPNTRSSAVTTVTRPNAVSPSTRSSAATPTPTTRTTISAPTRSSASAPTRSSASAPTRSSAGSSANRTSGGSSSRVSAGRR